MPNSLDDDVSPYLLRPRRSLTQVRREIEEKAKTARGTEQHPDDEAP